MITKLPYYSIANNLILLHPIVQFSAPPHVLFDPGITIFFILIGKKIKEAMNREFSQLEPIISLFDSYAKVFGKEHSG